MKSNKEIIEHSSDDMVTIDELLKDDPKALEDLEELRKSMEDNPGLFSFSKERITQGSRKMRQLLEDARRDNTFREKLSKILSNEALYSVGDLEELYSKYLQYFFLLDAFRKEFIDKNPSQQIKKELCKEYGIDPHLLDRLGAAALNNRLDGWDFSEETSGDVCIIESKDSENNPVDIHTFHLGIVDDIEKEVYPINLKLHRFASKRDVLDFVEKRWEDIKPFLSEKRTKERKTDRSIIDFIWKHRNEKANDIKTLLNERFPKHGLMYYQITRIISEEKKRRGYQTKKNKK